MLVKVIDNEGAKELVLGSEYEIGDGTINYMIEILSPGHLQGRFFARNRFEEIIEAKGNG